MKGLHGGIPLAVLAAVARSQAQAVSYDNQVNNWSSDDHSVHVHDNGPVYPRAAASSGAVRHPPPTSVDGPTGDDQGQNLDIPISGHYSTEFTGWHHDDHHVDVNNNNPYPYPPWFGRRALIPSASPSSVPLPSSTPSSGAGSSPESVSGPTGDDGGQSLTIPISGSYSSEFNNWRSDDHSTDVNNNGYWRRALLPNPSASQSSAQPSGTPASSPDSVDGPTGDDGGQSLTIPISGYYSSEFNWWNKDDHSTDVNNNGYPYPYAKRSPQPSGSPESVDGPTGDDGGQNLGIPISADYSNEVNWYNHDDHSVDVNNNGYPYPYVKRTDGPASVDGPTGDDGGQSLSVPVSGSSTNVDNLSSNDDHSVTVDNGPSPAGMDPANHGPAAASSSSSAPAHAAACSANVEHHTVFHTVTQQAHAPAAAPVTVTVTAGCSPSNPVEAPASSPAPSTSVAQLFAPSASATPSSSGVAPQRFGPSSSVVASSSASASASSSMTPITGAAGSIHATAGVAAVVGVVSAVLAFAL